MYFRVMYFRHVHLMGTNERCAPALLVTINSWSSSTTFVCSSIRQSILSVRWCVPGKSSLEREMLAEVERQTAGVAALWILANIDRSVIPASVDLNVLEHTACDGMQLFLCTSLPRDSLSRVDSCGYTQRILRKSASNPTFTTPETSRVDRTCRSASNRQNYNPRRCRGTRGT